MQNISKAAVASAAILFAAIGAAVPAHAGASEGVAESCEVRSISLEESETLAQTCDLTGFTVVLPSGITLVVPQPGESVTASNTMEEGSTHLPHSTLLNTGDAIAVAEDETTILATSDEAGRQLEAVVTPVEVDPSKSGRSANEDANRAAVAEPTDPTNPKCLAINAYTLQPKWSFEEYLYRWNTAGQPNESTQWVADFGTGKVKSGWSETCGQRYSGMYAMYELGKTTQNPGVTSTGCGGRDSSNVMGFGDISGGVLARTCWWTGTGTNGTFKNEADIMFDNSDRSWHIMFPTSGCTPGSYDIQGVALHEALHAVGLGHTSNQTQVMRETINACDFTWRDMGRGDQNGLIALYGGNS